MRYLSMLCLIFFRLNLQAQVDKFPYSENFDTVSVPELPTGWNATTSRSTSGDFTSTTSTVHSPPIALISTDATKPQSLSSPFLNFSNLEPESLYFFERRSGSHDSDVLIEASIDGGTTYSARFSDTLRNPGVTSYIPRALKFPDGLTNQPSVRLRWRVAGNGTGTQGTIRFDDVRMTVRTEFDIALSAMSLATDRSGNITVDITVTNTGEASASDFHIRLYRDLNNDSVADPSELVDERTLTASLFPHESNTTSFDIRSTEHGEISFIGTVDWVNDHALANNTLYRTLIVPYPTGALIINEIMYDPLPNQSEYVEIFNPSAEAIDVGDWKISDRHDTSATSRLHGDAPFIIPTGGYAVIANDSSIIRRFTYLTEPQYRLIIKRNMATLNNTGDSIILTDRSGHVIDSLRYSPDWNNPEIDDASGRSLERIDPSLPTTDSRNWSTCANPLGGTPGTVNSLFAASVPSSASIAFSPNPFSPDGDGFEDVTILRYQFPATAGLIRVRIFDCVGRLVRTLANNEPVGAQGELVWNGLDDNGEKVRMGVYVVLVESVDSFGGSSETRKGIVVVAAKL